MNIFRLIIIPVIFICSFLSFTTAYPDELIIPPKKPDLNINKKEASNLKSEILPLKKPKEDIGVVKKDNIKKKKIDLGIILPKNKPLILIKDKKVVDKKKIIKSKFYSKKKVCKYYLKVQIYYITYACLISTYQYLQILF